MYELRSAICLRDAKTQVATYTLQRLLRLPVNYSAATWATLGLRVVATEGLANKRPLPPLDGAGLFSLSKCISGYYLHTLLFTSSPSVSAEATHKRRFTELEGSRRREGVSCITSGLTSLTWLYVTGEALESRPAPSQQVSMLQSRSVLCPARPWWQS
jgi:hypothetical protein